MGFNTHSDYSPSIKISQKISWPGNATAMNKGTTPKRLL